MEINERRVRAGRHALPAVRPEATGSPFSTLEGPWESLFAFRMRGRLAGFLSRHYETSVVSHQLSVCDNYCLTTDD